MNNKREVTLELLNIDDIERAHTKKLDSTLVCEIELMDDWSTSHDLVKMKLIQQQVVRYLKCCLPGQLVEPSTVRCHSVGNKGRILTGLVDCLISKENSMMSQERIHVSVCMRH